MPPDLFSSTAASQTFSPSPAIVCGHPLDQSFGTTPPFIIHRAQDGDSLDLYANNYHTSVEAIKAVNYELPIPLRREWVLVIPVGATQEAGLPIFQPYLVSEMSSSIESLAGEFSTDPAAVKQYNELNDDCQTFSGWLLIPRLKHSS